MNVAIPPRSRNHRLPAACDAPSPSAASSVLRPFAISCQTTAPRRGATTASPGGFIGAQYATRSSTQRPAHRNPYQSGIATTIESAYFQSWAFSRTSAPPRNRPVDGQSRRPLQQQRRRELFFATLKKELIYRRSWPEKVGLRTEVSTTSRSSTTASEGTVRLVSVRRSNSRPAQ